MKATTLGKTIEKVAGFEIRKCYEVEFTYGKKWSEFDGHCNDQVITNSIFLGYKNNFGLFCEDLKSFKTLRSYISNAVKCIGIAQDEKTDDGNMYVIFINADRTATKVAYTGKKIMWIENYNEFDPYNDKFISEAAWRYLTFSKNLSNNKKCWSVIDWFLCR